MYPPTSPRCRSYTRLYPPTSCASPKLYLFLSLFSLTLPLPLNLCCLLTDYPAISSCHRFQVNFALLSSFHIILYIYVYMYTFLVLFVNSVSSRQRSLYPLYLSAFIKGSRRTVPFHNMQYILCYFIFYSIFLAFFHFSL